MKPLPEACAVPSEGLLTTRRFDEPAHPYRTPFERDRARIIHSRAFRRLAGKTQVFTERFSDHFRSRLTHTLEVAQIARALARTLGLNESLTEALALVHDIGHPPFGHAGEHALDRAMQQYGLRFDHNLHALRIVDSFEQRYLHFRGLNLTLGVREGIVKHSRDYSAEKHPELAEFFLDRRPPLEAQIIDLVDEVAYLTADLDDGIEAEILTLSSVRSSVALFERYYAPLDAEYPQAAPKLKFNEALKSMLNALVTDLAETTTQAVASHHLDSLNALRNYPKRVCAFSPEMEALRMEAKRFLYKDLYLSEPLERTHTEASRIIQDLFSYWVEKPTALPASYKTQIEQEGVPRIAADYIAGMTDSFILQLHRELFGN